MITQLNHYTETDILIIGGGLAGLTCGISACEENPGLRIMIALQDQGPAGSSFTNRNNALGIQVCENELEKDQFIHESLSLAEPGFINPDLVGTLAEESLDAFNKLQSLGIRFDRDLDGQLIRYAGCFSPLHKRAFIMRNLDQIYDVLIKRYVSLGGFVCENSLAVNLVMNDRESVVGALFLSEGHRLISIHSGSTVLAAGGTASLFRYHVCGKSVSGFAPSLIHDTGGTCVNMGFHQYVWYPAGIDDHIPVSSFLNSGCLIRNRHGREIRIPGELIKLAKLRNTHVPVGYGQMDSPVDLFLIQNADHQGRVNLYSDETGWIYLVPCAHASNGGALIDKNGQTSVPNLYACGECAGGMHGANRIGGAMIMAALVFGRRAGLSAANRYDIIGYPNKKEFLKDVSSSVSRFHYDPDELINTRKWLASYLNRHVLRILGGKGGCKSDYDILSDKLSETTDWQSRQVLKSALIITEPWTV